MPLRLHNDKVRDLLDKKVGQPSTTTVCLSSSSKRPLQSQIQRGSHGEDYFRWACPTQYHRLATLPLRDCHAETPAQHNIPPNLLGDPVAARRPVVPAKHPRDLVHIWDEPRHDFQLDQSHFLRKTRTAPLQDSHYAQVYQGNSHLACYTVLFHISSSRRSGAPHRCGGWQSMQQGIVS